MKCKSHVIQIYVISECAYPVNVAYTYVCVLQRQGGSPIIRVEREEYTGVFSSCSEDWHTRRCILTPAFSAHKMKLVRAD